MQTLDAKNAQIPILGLGTWELRGRECARVVEQAVRLGYRHFDTAQLYGNERDVGDGIRASGISRSDVFVVTKVAPDNLAPGLLIRSATGIRSPEASVRISLTTAVRMMRRRDLSPSGRMSSPRALIWV